VRSQLPEVTRLAHHRPVQIHRRHDFFTCLGHRPVQAVEIDRLEPRHLNLEIEVQGEQLVQLDLQDLFVPTRQFSHAVVGQGKRPLALRRQVLDLYRRHGCQVQLAGRQVAAVTGKDGPLLVDDDRDQEAEGRDAGRDLGHLLVGVDPRLAGVGLELSDRPQLKHRFERLNRVLQGLAGCRLAGVFIGSLGDSLFLCIQSYGHDAPPLMNRSPIAAVGERNRSRGLQGTHRLAAVVQTQATWPPKEPKSLDSAGAS